MNEKEKAAKLLHDAEQESRRLDLLFAKAKKQEETLKKIEEEKQININQEIRKFKSHYLILDKNSCNKIVILYSFNIVLNLLFYFKKKYIEIKGYSEKLNNIYKFKKYP